MAETITRERVGKLRFSQDDMLMKFQLLSQLIARFPTQSKFKKLPADELESLYYACRNTALNVAAFISDLVPASNDVIDGMEAVLANDDAESTLRRLSLNSDDQG